MSVIEYSYNSILADDILGYLALRASQGHSKKERYILQTLDIHLSKIGLKEKLLTPSHVDEWINTLPSKLSVNTKIVYISHFTQFAKYLHTLDIPAFIPERPTTEHLYIPYIFSQEEITKLFDAADSLLVFGQTRSLTHIQFPLVLRILYGCGMRIGEILSLKANDVDLNNGVIFVRNAKGNKDRVVPMDHSLVLICRRYYAVTCKNITEDTPLFENTNHAPRSGSWAGWRFQKVLKKSGISLASRPVSRRTICIHCLRHTFAVNSFRKQDLAGIDIYDTTPLLSTFMGHANLYGTETYLHMTAENSKDIVERMSPYAKNIFPEVPK
jgi:integrase/recombinase XerD